jgi:hypothetical protein
MCPIHVMFAPYVSQVYVPGEQGCSWQVRKGKKGMGFLTL